MINSNISKNKENTNGEYILFIAGRIYFAKSMKLEKIKEMIRLWFNHFLLVHFMQYLPFISVILPTKNNERTIRTCLESIFKQTYTNFEVIFVDNFSDDATFDIAKEYEVKGFAIHTYQVGPERNVQRHAGYEHASGDILYFIDSDMYINPILLEEISSIFEDSNTGAIIIPEENMTGE